MKRFIPFLFLVLPMALFAQSPRDQESTMLKKFGLSDPQITQVLDIQGKTEATVQQDSAQLRLLRAQMDKALLPASPDTPAVNGYITQIGQTRADMMRTFVTARIQLRQIIGDDNFPAYSRSIMHRYGPREGRGGFSGRARVPTERPDRERDPVRIGT